MISINSGYRYGPRHYLCYCSGSEEGQVLRQNGSLFCWLQGSVFSEAIWDRDRNPYPAIECPMLRSWLVYSNSYDSFPNVDYLPFFSLSCLAQSIRSMVIASSSSVASSCLWGMWPSRSWMMMLLWRISLRWKPTLCHQNAIIWTVKELFWWFMVYKIDMFLQDENAWDNIVCDTWYVL